MRLPVCALKVPFGYPAEARAERRVAVICHAFHPELVAEAASYFENIPGRIDLFLSTDSEEKRQHILSALSGWQDGPAEVRVAENRGRDVAHKFITFRDVYERYELILFAHTKRSSHSEYGDSWRSSLLTALAGTERTAGSILELFDQIRTLGIVFPEHHPAIRDRIEWGGNFEKARELARKMGVPLKRRGALDFAAGSMFWARAAALRPILDLNLGFDDFPPEQGQEDATLAHAIERLILFSCERAGFTWLKVTSGEGGQVRHVRSARELAPVVKQCTVSLIPTHKRGIPIGRAKAALKRVRRRARAARKRFRWRAPGRLSRAAHQLFGRRPDRARRFWLKELNGCEGGHVCLYVAYAAGNRLQPHSVDGARRWAAQGFRLILIIASDDPTTLVVDDDLGFCSGVMVRQNSGYDFGAWATGILTIPSVRHADLLALANDSVFGPFDGYAELAARLANADADVIGVTDSYEVRHHLQSYVLFFRKSALANAGFWRFWRKVRTGDRWHVIRYYELRMKDQLSAAGLRVAALFPADRTAAPHNPTHRRWRELLEEGFPFIKAQLLRENPLQIDLDGWEAMVAARGGDPGLIKRAVGRPEQ